jgi:hypothetical protein
MIGPVSRRIDMYAVLFPLLSFFPDTARADDDFREFKGHEGPTRVVRFTPEGQTLISCNDRASYIDSHRGRSDRSVLARSLKSA